MKIFSALVYAALLTTEVPAAADTHEQGPTQAIDAALPDPAHIAIRLGKDIKWEKGEGESKALLFGDPDAAGLYGMLIRWEPGHYSRPHFHSADRHIYVISGTWWMSSSDKFDPASTYPVPAGSSVTHFANTVHWDGAKDAPCLLLLVGMGPVVTTRLPK